MQLLDRFFQRLRSLSMPSIFLNLKEIRAMQSLTGWEPAKDQFPNDPPEREPECTESHCASHPPPDVHQSQCKRHIVNHPAVPSLCHSHKSYRSKTRGPLPAWSRSCH